MRKGKQGKEEALWLEEEKKRIEREEEVEMKEREERG